MSSQKVNWRKVAKDYEGRVDELLELVKTQSAVMTEQGNEIERLCKISREVCDSWRKALDMVADNSDYVRRLEAKVLEHEIGPPRRKSLSASVIN